MRNLNVIAAEIDADWTKVNYAAAPYLNAMYSLQTMQDSYWNDSAYSVVAYFLANATSWRGDVARRVKKELNDMLKT